MKLAIKFTALALVGAYAGVYANDLRGGVASNTCGSHCDQDSDCHYKYGYNQECPRCNVHHNKCHQPKPTPPPTPAPVPRPPGVCTASCTSNRDCHIVGGSNPCNTCDMTVGTRYGGQCFDNSKRAMCGNYCEQDSDCIHKYSYDHTCATCNVYDNECQDETPAPSPAPAPRAPGACTVSCTSDRDCDFEGGHNPCNTCDTTVGTLHGGTCIDTSEESDAASASVF